MNKKGRDRSKIYKKPVANNVQLEPFLFDFDEVDNDLNHKLLGDIQHGRKRTTDIDWSDEELFGDDDAAFVDIKSLNDFSVVRTDCKKFFNCRSKFVVLNAPKGSGKTTMCRMLEHSINNNESGDYAIWLRDPDISPKPSQALMLSDWIHRWSNNIAYAILCMLVDKIEGVITNSDLIDIVDTKRSSGEMHKGFLVNFTESFKLPFLKNKNLPDKFKISYQDILSRIDKNLKNKAWIFIDEVDQGFSKSEQLIFKNSAALIACRNLASKLDNVVIRSTIRPNVLSVLQSEVDSIANIADSIVPLDWNALQLRSVVAKRVEAYLKKTNNFFVETFESDDERENWLLSQIIKTEDPNLGLGKGSRLVHMTLAVLGKNRPRWVLNLLKEAAKIASYNRESLITPAELFGCLREYGNERLKNIAAEFRSICEQVQNIVTKFSLSKKIVFRHVELIFFIEKNILSKENPIEITGVTSNASAMDIAELLYLIGFIDAAYLAGEASIYGKETLRKKHMDFYDQPVLMNALAESGVQIEKFVWEIHPAFRYALGLERKKWNK